MAECPICFENITFPSCIKPCNHMFCNKCIVKWMKKHKNCPLCRELCTLDINKEETKEYSYFSGDRDLYIISRLLRI